MSEEKPNALDLLADERAAIDLIARTPHGHLLHRYLRRILESVYDTPEQSALQSHNGRRSLARDLMREMAQGIEDSVRAGDGSHQRSGQQPVLTRSGKPVRTGRQFRSAREFLVAAESERSPVSGGNDEA